MLTYIDELLSIRSAIELIQGFRQLGRYSACVTADQSWIVGALWQIQKILDNELLDMLLRMGAHSNSNIDCHSAIWSLYT